MNSLPVNSFKQALHANRRQVGLWVTFAHQQIAEVLACAGFDWLLFDMEHSPTDLYDVGQQLLAVRGTPTAAVVRVPILDMAWIKRVLDAGAPNIMVPNVRNAQEAREAVAKRYDIGLAGTVDIPRRVPGAASAWAQYCILVERRDAVAAALKTQGIPTAVYYPKPMHLQPAYAQFGGGSGSLPVSESLAGHILALPMSPYLTAEETSRVIAAVKAAV